MRKYYVLKYRKSPAADVIRKDTMEMYHFSSINVGNSRKITFLPYAASFAALIFPDILLLINPEYRVFCIILVTLALFTSFAAVLRDENKRKVSLLDSIRMEKNRFVPTKEYLKALKKEQVQIIILSFSLIISISFPLFFVFYDNLVISSNEDYWLYVFSLVYPPALIYILLTSLISFFSNCFALRRYEKINEERLNFDGPVVYPDWSSETYLTDSTMPLYACIDELVFDKVIAGYQIEDVDTFFRGLRRDILNGYDIPADRIRKAVFHRVSVFKTGYNITDVDAALEYIEKRIGEQHE